MDFLKKLFGGGGERAPQDNAIHLYVKCNKCGAPVHVRIDARNDLSPEYGDSDEAAGYTLVKEIMDAKCFKLMRAEVQYDRARRETGRTLEGGTFLTKAEYEGLVAGTQ